jgi:hypothetical protein
MGTIEFPTTSIATFQYGEPILPKAKLRLLETTTIMLVPVYNAKELAKCYVID